MDCTRNKINKIVQYITKLGLDVHFNTKARGHQGFFLKDRIDISKSIPKDKILQTILHEFTHYIHYRIESDVNKTKGHLNVIFNTNENLEQELINVTNFVDENSKFLVLKNHKSIIKSKIQQQEQIIKREYPKFQRSKKFKEFDKFIKHSKARYLLKYDRVKYITPFLRRVEYYTVDNIEKDFKMSEAFAAYIRLRSYQRKQARISAKINKLKKYYTSPTELFARFVEGVYLDENKVKQIAPKAYKNFTELLNQGYYLELSNVLSMALEQKQQTYL